MALSTQWGPGPDKRGDRRRRRREGRIEGGGGDGGDPVRSPPRSSVIWLGREGDQCLVVSTMWGVLRLISDTGLFIRGTPRGIFKVCIPPAPSGLKLRASLRSETCSCYSADVGYLVIVIELHAITFTFVRI